MHGKHDICTYCGLPRTALSNQGHRLSGLHHKTHAFQDLLHVFITRMRRYQVSGFVCVPVRIVVWQTGVI